jgi:hypothetical protein
MSTKDLLKNEIEILSEPMIEEIFDFVKFLEARQERLGLIRAAQKTAESALKNVWENSEDAVYDRL